MTPDPNPENKPAGNLASKTSVNESPIEGEHLIEPENALAPIEWDQLPPMAAEAARKAGWRDLMPVQSRSIPYLLKGRDLMVQSRTGSGKTGAFLLPILSRIDPDRPQCQALVLAPTRELANQISREAQMLSARSEVRSIAVYGGVGYGAQLDAFAKGAHLVVGTPGRILDHLMRGSLRLDDLRILVFDEADRLMSMGFYPDMIAVRRFLPRRRDGFMFSATFPSTVQRLARQFLDEPDFLSLSSDTVHVASTEHVFYAVPGMDKDRTLVRVIELENPESALIFCNTKMIVNFVTRVLQRLGYDADQLTSDLAQNKREKVLERVKAGRLRILVATDVAARGIDIINLSHVFQYDVPEDTESYIHRAGRTGRAGAAGVAITLAGKHERAAINRIARIYKIEMEERPIPSDEDVVTIVSQRLTALLEAQLRDLDSQEAQRMERLMPLARKLCENEDSLALAAMLLDDSYHNSLHAPPPSDGEAAAERRRSRDREEKGAREKHLKEKEEPEREIDVKRVIERLENKRLGRDRLQVERMKRFIPLAQDFSQSEDELALIAMLLDEFERQPAQSPPTRSQSQRATRGAKPERKQSSRRRRGASEPRKRRR